jgi:hypothetical protein
MREAFTLKRFNRASEEVIDTANAICSEYRDQGYNLTLRQVYYQFVARGLLTNSDRSYKRLGSIINDARLAGLMDWAHIQDRTREIAGGFGGYRNPGEFMDSMASRYIERLWRDQSYRPEVWVEKDALKDVVGQACGPYRVPYFSCRGYVSQTAMYDAAKRIESRVEQGLIPVLIHLGDHDPSGIDMSRDIEDRLTLMSGTTIRVQRIALNMDQVEQYGPPPNPAKLTDSRGSSYVEEYGNESWELDALEPSVLTSLIQDAIEEVLDRDTFDAAYEHEQEQTERIRQVAERFTDLDANWPDVEALLDGAGS